jgi:hypothetical protein
MYVSPQTDRLPHEPRRVRWSTVPFLGRLLAKVLVLALLALLTAGLWPPFLLGVMRWGWPPHQPRLWQFRRYLRLTWTVSPPEPGIAPLSRVYLILTLVQRFLLLPASGVAWYLDEVLYGRRLADTSVRKPLFLLSAARSGSTQISRYLESDPRLVAPTVLQTLLPYLWVWRLAAPTLGRVVPRRWGESLAEAIATEEFFQRHELSPYHTDTFEVLFYATHLNMFSFCLGPEVLSEDVSFSSMAEHNRQLWEEDFVDFIDALGRKTLLFAGPGEGGQPRRLYVKGHFQPADDALAQRYPDAHFLTVIRNPASRLQSMLNHAHGNAPCEALGAVPWTWLARSLPDDEAAYCQREQDWFTRPEGPSRTVIRFTDYVADLKGTMALVYRQCMGDEVLPAHVPTEHTPRERKNYRVNRSLSDLGIDAEAYGDRLSDYQAWCLRGAG